MGLREEAIGQYERKEMARIENAAADKKARIDRDLMRAEKRICEAFGLENAPNFKLVPIGDRYWPDCFFVLDGITFEYVLTDGSMRVEVICEKCRHAEMVRFEIPTPNGGSDFSQLGEALLYMRDPGRHRCPADQPPAPANPTPEPPKIVTYAIGSVEQRFLEALDELVFDAVRRRVEGG